MRVVLSSEAFHELTQTFFSFTKHDQFLQHGTWIYDNHVCTDPNGFTENHGRLMLKNYAVVDVEYRMFNCVLISRNPLKVDCDIHVYSMSQVMADVIKENQ